MEVFAQFSIYEWIGIIAAAFVFVKGVYDCIVWILDKLNIYHKVRSREEMETEMIKRHEEVIGKLSKQYEDTLEISKIQFRHSIVRACEEYMRRGYVLHYELESTEEMYETYKNVLKGNSYVTTLMQKIRQLPIQTEGVTTTQPAQSINITK